MQMSGLTYRCSANESFDSVALYVYGNEKYAADLMNANPECCRLVVFNGGERLRLPVVDIPDENTETALANTIAPWKT